MIKKALLVLVMLLLTVNVAWAQSTDYDGPRTDHVAGGFEKVIEKVTMYTKFGKKAKVGYMEKILDKRLAELAYAVDNNQDLIETSASRYSTYIGNLTNYVVKNNLSEKKDDLLNLYSRHGENLAKLRDKYEADSGWWLAIQHDVNNTEWLSDDLKKL